FSISGLSAKLLSTFRLCLHDNNAHVIHHSLIIELLEDSIQHTANSYILAKVALAQLIDDINFRILTYLEQQQYPDICVRQATTSTFA
ncbi:unnamed protein product, partial [Rotaria sp. Silwood2]